MELDSKKLVDESGEIFGELLFLEKIIYRCESIVPSEIVLIRKRH